MPRLASLRFAMLSLPLVLGVGFACQTPDFDESDGSAGDSNNSTSSGDGDGDPTTGDGDPSTGDGDATFNCNPDIDVSCPQGQKCTVLTTGAGSVYECVPDDTDKLSYEACTPQPTTGQDGCPNNHTCIAPLDSMNGYCLELCSGDSGCTSALCTNPPGLQLQVCAAICDPLSAFCPDLQACQRVRQASFVCQYPLPTDNGTTAQPCSGADDAGCAEGFVCETGGIIPGCTDPSCCTALCDLSAGDTCTSPMLCGELPLDPQPGLEDVGACYVPQ